MADEGTPQQGQGPWSDDLNLIFQDEATRAQVDQFLRSKVQPYTTKLEQDVAQYRGQVESDEFVAAQRLYNDFASDPQGTYTRLTQELHPDQAAEVLDYLYQQQQEVAQQATQEAQQEMSFTPEQEQALAWAENQQAVQAYEAEKAGFLAANPEINGGYIDHFAASTANDDGTINWDAAAAAYRDFAATFTPQVETPAAEEPKVETPAAEEPKVEAEAKPEEDEAPAYTKRGTPQYDPKRALAYAVKGGVKALKDANSAPATL